MNKYKRFSKWDKLNKEIPIKINELKNNIIKYSKA